ncbi:MAG: hypothetical protein WC325_08455 [Candidatus Bathyarchaeia archaeon]|jgi:hypothetical protein
MVNYTLTVVNTGYGTTTPAAGANVYASGTVVTVTAVPNTNYFLFKWVIDTVDSGATNPTTVTMSADHTIEAVFYEDHASNVTLRTLSLGTQDTVTGHYSKSYATTAIRMILLPKGASKIINGVGFYGKYDVTGFSADALHEGDQIIDAFGNYFSVELCEAFDWLNSRLYYTSSLVKLNYHADEPATSGTWHLDTDSLNDDPRYRIKVWLDTYLLAANLTKNDGATECSFITCFSGADYPLTTVFDTKTVDLVYTVNDPESTPFYNGDKSIYGYEEKVPVEITTIDKSGISGKNLRWKAECELRRLCETYAFSSLRVMEKRRENTVRAGALIFYSVIFDVTYRRIKA